jgi:predicted ester cyclase
MDARPAQREPDAGAYRAREEVLEANKMILRRHFDEVLNLGNLSVIDDIYSDRYVLDAPVQTDGSIRASGKTYGRDGLKRRVVLFRSAFPDIHFTIGALLAEGDQVAVQYTFKGTHRGNFGELEPTGRSVAVTGILIAQLIDSKIATAFSVFDSKELLNQLESKAETAPAG